MLELVLTRIFSVTLYYHFAFMAISLALFGSGASGVFVYLGSSRFNYQSAPRQMAFSSMLMAISTIVSLMALLNVTFGLVPSRRGYVVLGVLYVICALPFFFTGVCLSIAMKHLASHSGKLYFFDLAGASLGCFLVIPSLNLLGGPTTMLLVGVLGAIGALIFSSLAGNNRRLTALAAILILVCTTFVLLNTRSDLLTIIWAKGSREQPPLFAKWNSFSRVTVKGDLDGDKPLWITIDSDAGTPILRFSENPDAMGYVENAVSALAYHVKKEPKVLVIGPGGGREVVTALEAGSKDVTGVEVNPIIVNDIMGSEPYVSFSGHLYQRPGVKVVVDEGRSFIRSSDQKFDIIQASLIDTWAANSAGAFALTENNLYTVEAFKLYLDHLTDDGVLTMTRWLLDPPQQELRLMSLAREVMSQNGIPRPERHLCIFKAPGRGERVESCFLFKKSEFTDLEIDTLQKLATQNRLEVLYTPLTRLPNVFTELATATNPESFYGRYPINIRPTVDNSPFFFYHVTPGDVLETFRLTNESQKTNMGVFILFSLLIITTTLVGLFMLGPMFIARRRAKTGQPTASLRNVIYFGFLGLGFIMIEIALVQRFILFLGYPVYALAVVLSSLLLCSGLGSLLTSRISRNRITSSGKAAMAAIVALTVLYVPLLPAVFNKFGGQPIGLRIALTVILLIPLAAVLGMPMPIGIRLIARKSPELVPWAWGINGATSVMGSVISVIVAMNLGFNQALIIGSVAYVVAFLLIPGLSHERVSESEFAEVSTEPVTVGD